MRTPIPWLISDYGAQYLLVLGLFALFKMLKAILFHVAWMIKTYAPTFYRPYSYPRVFYGEWAAITGCTSGIGLSLAKELAQRGINVILISRSKDKLEALSKELEENYKVKTIVILNDASSRESTQKMAEELASLDIGILINNVGINFEEKLRPYNESRLEWVLGTMTINAGNSAMTLKQVLPKMFKKRKGAVVNVCSSSSYVPVPLQALYSATKVYKDVLTRAIGKELESTGVAVQSICPLLVKSKMTYATSDFVYNFLSITGETYARSFFNLLGTCKRTGGHWVFDLIYGYGLLAFNETALVYLLGPVINLVARS